MAFNFSMFVSSWPSLAAVGVRFAYLGCSELERIEDSGSKEEGGPIGLTGLWT